MKKTRDSKSVERRVERISGYYQSKTFKTVILGDYASGKTSIVKRFVNGEYEEYEEGTIGAKFYTKSIDIGNSITHKFEIVDIGGLERYISLEPMYCRMMGHIYFICFDDKNNFETAKKIKRRVDLYIRDFRQNSITVLVKTRSDLFSYIDGDADNELRQNARLYTEKNGLLFFECSAKCNAGIEEIFLESSEKAIRCNAYNSPKQDVYVIFPDSDEEEDKKSSDKSKNLKDQKEQKSFLQKLFSRDSIPKSIAETKSNTEQPSPSQASPTPALVSSAIPSWQQVKNLSAKLETSALTVSPLPEINSQAESQELKKIIQELKSITIPPTAEEKKEERNQRKNLVFKIVNKAKNKKFTELTDEMIALQKSSLEEDQQFYQETESQFSSLLRESAEVRSSSAAIIHDKKQTGLSVLESQELLKEFETREQNLQSAYNRLKTLAEKKESITQARRNSELTADQQEQIKIFMELLTDHLSDLVMKCYVIAKKLADPTLSIKEKISLGGFKFGVGLVTTALPGIVATTIGLFAEYLVKDSYQQDAETASQAYGICRVRDVQIFIDEFVNFFMLRHQLTIANLLPAAVDVFARTTVNRLYQYQLSLGSSALAYKTLNSIKRVPEMLAETAVEYILGLKKASPSPRSPDEISNQVKSLVIGLSLWQAPEDQAEHAAPVDEESINDLVSIATGNGWEYRKAKELYRQSPMITDQSGGYYQCLPSSPAAKKNPLLAHLPFIYIFNHEVVDRKLQRQDQPENVQLLYSPTEPRRDPQAIIRNLQQQVKELQASLSGKDEELAAIRQRMKEIDSRLSLSSPGQPEQPLALVVQSLPPSSTLTENKEKDGLAEVNSALSKRKTVTSSLPSSSLFASPALPSPSTPNHVLSSLSSHSQEDTPSPD